MSGMIVALAPAVLGEVDWLAPVAAAATIARSSGASVAAVVAGGDGETAQSALDAGASAVWLVSHPGLGDPPDVGQVAGLFAQALKQAELRDHRLALVPPGALTEMIAATLAVHLDGAAIGLCADIALSDTAVTAQRPAYGGRVVMTVTCTGTRCYGAMRAPKPIHAGASREGPVHRLELTEPLPQPLPTTRRNSGLSTANLEGAKVVVSGGRGMGGKEGFAPLAELAGCLGGALGGSLPAVDAGWVPVFRQVGQSGKFVTPEVYVAVGISGTPQHLAGIAPSTRIVAINKDAEADIFRFAEIGMVAEWKDALPALISRLKETA
jgi:electron transfer flavoprotein alpha subunit